MKEENINQNEVPSPCVGICCPDAEDICMGCFRTTEEISRWWDMSHEEKWALLEVLKERAGNGV